MAGPRTGVGRYLEYVVGSWSEHESPFEQVQLFSPAPIRDLPNDGRFSVQVEPTRGPGIWWQASRLRRKASSADVLYAPYTLPPGYRAPSVVANLGILEGPNRMPGVLARLRSWHFASSARSADTVIVNSEASKTDLVNYYGTAADKITVIWPGVDSAFRPAVEGEEKLIAAAVERFLGDECEYFIFVGKLSPRRNVPALLEAFSQIVALHPHFRLLLAGPDTGEVPLHTVVAELGLERSVRHAPHVEHDQLALLYRGARAFVLPSLQESFPTTTLEALASGCPVGTVSYPALTETGLDEAVVAVPDARPDTLASALRQLVEDDALHRELSERGPGYARSFSWDRTASQTMEVLTRVAQR